MKTVIDSEMSPPSDGLQHHKIILKSFIIFVGQDEKAREELAINMVANDGAGTSIADAILPSPAKIGRKRSIENVELDAETSAYIDNLLGLWIASSTLPVSLVDNENMERFVKALHPQVTYWLYFIPNNDDQLLVNYQYFQIKSMETPKIPFSSLI